MICFLHGYLLEGSGSNLWTRSVIQSMCRAGHTVHLVCQENHPERYDFIAEARVYHLNGNVETTLSRPVPYAGRCIMHKPQLGDTLPVYVWDKYEEFSRVVPMVDLPDDEIESYIDRNVDVVRRIIRDNSITVVQANHLVLMSVVAQRVGAELGVPFVIMPHGSALEYAVKPDPRFREYARHALRSARRVLVSSSELGERVLALFPDMPGLAGKTNEIRVGVDTSSFMTVRREQRPRNVARVIELLASLPRGAEGEHDAKLPDADAEEQLRGVEWIDGQVIIFVGRIIVAKGIHCLVAAMPEILRQYPRAQLLVAGHGPLREPLEKLLHALRNGDRTRALRIATGDADEDRLESERMDGVPEYWDALAARGELDAYYDAAQRLLREDSVRFIGYFTHRELSWLFPCCDVGVFPSMVKESGPMVFLEALSSGCFPIGTYFAGTKGKIDTVAPHLCAEDAELMKARPDPAHLASDLARVVPGALGASVKYAETLRAIAQQEYDWLPISTKLAELLGDVAAAG